MSQQSEHTLSQADYKSAMTEVSFLLDILATTVDDLMGGGTVSVGRIAGRNQARRLPIYVETPTLPLVVEELNRVGKLGAEFKLEASGKSVTFRHCAIRAVCQDRKLELGGNLCRLYHFYWDGLVNEFLGRPTRSTIVESGSQCQTQLELR